MAKQIYNVVHPRETRDGQTFWDRVGVMVVEKEAGQDAKINIRLDSLPAHDWDGWLKAFPKDDRGGRRDEEPSPPPPRSEPESRPSGPESDGPTVDPNDDNIPF